MAISNGFVVLFTFIAMIIIGGFIAVMLLLIKKFKDKKNFIDIAILEIVKGTYMYRIEKGRFLIDPHKGRVLVTCKKGLNANSVKDRLSYHINDEDLVPSMMGVGRKFIVVARKNGLTASMNYLVSNKDLSDEEKDLLISINKKYNNQIVNIDDVPKSMSLKPITAEQTRFALDITKDSQKLYFDEDKRTARALMMNAVLILGLVILAAVVILIILMNQGPSFAEDVARSGAAAATNTANALPGVPLPT